jgi:hypothetical protein
MRVITFSLVSVIFQASVLIAGVSMGLFVPLEKHRRSRLNNAQPHGSLKGVNWRTKTHLGGWHSVGPHLSLHFS